MPHLCFHHCFSAQQPLKEDTLWLPREQVASSSAPSLGNARSSEYESKRKKTQDNNHKSVGLVTLSVQFTLILRSLGEASANAVT